LKIIFEQKQRMIKSMTGYGKAEYSSDNFYIKTEVRSLNGKFFDLNLRYPPQFREKEMGVRNMLSEKIVRGKCDVQLVFEATGAIQSHTINKELVKAYIKDINAIEKVSPEAALRIAMQMPDVIITAKDENYEQEWESMLSTLTKALSEFNHFRETEGQQLQQDVEARIQTILQLLVSTEAFETERIEAVKGRIRSGLQDMEGASMDENRFEQELIYYLERMNFSEEKTRLRSHCDFFVKTMNEQDSNGRKLNFISQEMGREINTLGSKANHAEIQKLVVMMKDELEKVKEQLLNVL